MIVLGIDPGPYESAVCGWDGWHVLRGSYQANEIHERELRGHPSRAVFVASPDATFDIEFRLAIEQPRSFGKHVGNEIVQTAEWAGRFAGICAGAMMIPQTEVRRHLCGTAASTCAGVKRVLQDRFGAAVAKGTRKAPGPMYGANEHVWDALAVAVSAYDILLTKRSKEGGQ